VKAARQREIRLMTSRKLPAASHPAKTFPLRRAIGKFSRVPHHTHGRHCGATRPVLNRKPHQGSSHDAPSQHSPRAILGVSSLFTSLRGGPRRRSDRSRGRRRDCSRLRREWTADISCRWSLGPRRREGDPPASARNFRTCMLHDSTGSIQASSKCLRQGRAISSLHVEAGPRTCTASLLRATTALGKKAGGRVTMKSRHHGGHPCERARLVRSVL